MSYVDALFASSDDEDDELNRTPIDIIDAAKDVEAQLLPPKSRERYERTYKEFLKWRREQKTDSLSERTLLAYFGYLADTKHQKPTTLWSYYSMLRSLINLNEEVDISKYVKLVGFLKRKSDGYRPVRAKTFTEAELRRFIQEAPHDEWLVVKVVCVFGLYGACRTDEFVNIHFHHVKEYHDMFLVELEQTKTKKPRTFAITGEHRNIVESYRKLRPRKVLTNRFFLNYQRGKCTAQVIGKTKFSQMPKQIATFLGLTDADRYTGHAFRRTSASVLSNTGKADLLRVKKHGGWRSDAVAQQYVDESLAYKKETANIIEAAITSNDLGNDSVSGRGVDSVDDRGVYSIDDQAVGSVNNDLCGDYIVSQVAEVCKVVEMNSVSVNSKASTVAVPCGSNSNKGEPVFSFANCSGNITINYTPK